MVLRLGWVKLQNFGPCRPLTPLAYCKNISPLLRLEVKSSGSESYFNLIHYPHFFVSISTSNSQTDNPLKLVVTIRTRTTCFNNKYSCTLPTKSIYLCRTIIRINGEFFPKYHYQIDLRSLMIMGCVFFEARTVSSNSLLRRASASKGKKPRNDRAVSFSFKLSVI